VVQEVPFDETAIELFPTAQNKSKLGDQHILFQVPVKVAVALHVVPFVEVLTAPPVSIAQNIPN
jgi:hypothetical protein